MSNRTGATSRAGSGPDRLAAIVREALVEQRQVAPARCIQLHLPAAGRHIPVWADADRIRQDMANWLANALKYAPPDRPVEAEPIA